MYKKSVAFLYTNSKLSEWEIKKTIPFTIASKRIKHLGINNQGDKTLKKEMEEDTDKWKDITCWKNYCQNIHTSQEIYRFNTIPIKYKWYFSQK